MIHGRDPDIIMGFFVVTVVLMTLAKVLDCLFEEVGISCESFISIVEKLMQKKVPKQKKPAWFPEKPVYEDGKSRLELSSSAKASFW